ncbi:MAG TPA: hypothetical protein VNU45_19790 [Rummeliibacillus sp.]|nr:hypothetical protein [Rummeliibacillus sp.]
MESYGLNRNSFFGKKYFVLSALDKSKNRNFMIYENIFETFKEAELLRESLKKDESLKDIIISEVSVGVNTK